jgi:glycerol-3-phosphate dehydrogenase (NAD(P)+)
MQYEISVIGGGAWGTTLANMLTKNGYKVVIYVREHELIESINERHENELYLEDIKLHNNLRAESFDLISDNLSNYIVWTIPVVFSLNALEKYGKYLVNKNILIASKGIDFNTKKPIYDLIAHNIKASISIISGPTFAYEVASEKPTAATIASKSINVAKIWQTYLSSQLFRVYTSTDVKGVELGGSLKNVIAIAAGISDGLELGLNARSAMITRGLAEITRLGIKMGGKLETFMGLSGMGDLVLTCTGDLSRNRTVGKRLARGETLDVVIKSMKGVAEGVHTVKAAKYLQIFYQVEMPIVEEVYRLLYENKNIYESIMDLMNRPLKNELI